ncbi:MAG: sigma 54-interacting transcriptional regulator [Desulfovermiculus sp.]
MTEKNHAVWNVRFLNQIMDSMAEGVFTLDTQGRITSWNRSMEQITGYDSSEALGRSCEILGFSRCLGRVCPADVRECGILEHESPEAKECVLRHREGRDIPVIKQARVVKDEEGQVIGIVETVTDMTELHKARHKAEEARHLLSEHYRFANILGKSQAMQEVFSRVRAAADSRSTVLIHGESGTGKELIARAIHYNSEQAEQPFVTVNCSALTETLLESELFGHVKGAFTGAVKDRRGRFEEAHGGSIFLDEIGELSPSIQVKLLRVLQEREVERVGESRSRKIDIRVIGATHRDLESLLAQGAFRQDLYYRLKVFPIHLPPLRERREDLPLLVSHFIAQQSRETGKRITGIEPQAMRLILDYEWPGNVRELENAVEHAFVLASQDMIRVNDLPGEIASIRKNRHQVKEGLEQKAPVRRGAGSQVDREQLLELLHMCQWNKAEVARQLNISRTAVWKYMKKWNIPLKPDS